MAAVDPSLADAFSITTDPKRYEQSIIEGEANAAVDNTALNNLLRFTDMTSVEDMTMAQDEADALGSNVIESDDELEQEDEDEESGSDEASAVPRKRRRQRAQEDAQRRGGPVFNFEEVDVDVGQARRVPAGSSAASAPPPPAGGGGRMEFDGGDFPGFVVENGLVRKMANAGLHPTGYNRWINVAPADYDLGTIFDVSFRNQSLHLHMPSYMIKDSDSKLLSMGVAHSLNDSLFTISALLTAISSTILASLGLPDDYGRNNPVADTERILEAASKSRGGKVVLPPPRVFISPSGKRYPFAAFIRETVFGRADHLVDASATDEDMANFSTTFGALFPHPSEAGRRIDRLVPSDVDVSSMTEEEYVAHAVAQHGAAELASRSADDMDVDDAYRLRALREQAAREYRAIQSRRARASCDSPLSGASRSHPDHETVWGYTNHWHQMTGSFNFERAISCVIFRLSNVRAGKLTGGGPKESSSLMQEYEQKIGREIMSLYHLFEQNKVPIPRSGDEFAMCVQAYHTYITGISDSVVYSNIASDLDSNRPSGLPRSGQLYNVLSMANVIRFRTASVHYELLASGNRTVNQITNEQMIEGVSMLWGPQCLLKSYGLGAGGPDAIDARMVATAMAIVPAPMHLDAIARLTTPFDDRRERAYFKMDYADRFDVGPLKTRVEEQRREMREFYEALILQARNEYTAFDSMKSVTHVSTQVGDGMEEARRRFVFYQLQDECQKRRRPFVEAIENARRAYNAAKEALDATEVPGWNRQMFPTPEAALSDLREIFASISDPDDESVSDFLVRRHQLEQWIKLRDHVVLCEEEWKGAVHSKRVQFDLVMLKRMMETCSLVEGNSTGLRALSDHWNKVVEEGRSTVGVATSGVELDKRFKIKNGTHWRVPLDPKQSNFQNYIHRMMIFADRILGLYNSHIPLFQAMPVLTGQYNLKLGEQRVAYYLDGDPGAGKTHLIEVLMEMMLSFDRLVHVTQQAYNTTAINAGTVRVMPDLDERHAGVNRGAGAGKAVTADAVIKEALTAGMGQFQEFYKDPNDPNQERKTRNGIGILCYSWLTAGNFPWTSMLEEMKQRLWPIYISAKLEHQEGSKSTMKSRDAKVDLEARRAVYDELKTQTMWIGMVMLACQLGIGFCDWDMSISEEIVNEFNRRVQMETGASEAPISGRTQSMIMTAIKHYSICNAISWHLGSIKTLIDGRVAMEPSLEWVLDIQAMAVVPNEEITWFVLSLYSDHILQTRVSRILSQTFSACNVPEPVDFEDLRAAADQHNKNLGAPGADGSGSLADSTKMEFLVDGGVVNYHYQKIPHSPNTVIRMLANRLSREWTTREIEELFDGVHTESGRGGASAARVGRLKYYTSVYTCISVPKRTRLGLKEFYTDAVTNTRKPVMVRLPIMLHDSSGDCCYMLTDMHKDIASDLLFTALDGTCDRYTRNRGHTIALGIPDVFSPGPSQHGGALVTLPNNFAAYDPVPTNRRPVFYNPYDINQRTHIAFYQTELTSTNMELEKSKGAASQNQKILAGNIELKAFKRYYERFLPKSMTIDIIKNVYPKTQCAYTTRYFRSDAEPIEGTKNLSQQYKTMESLIDRISAEQDGSPRCLSSAIRFNIQAAMHDYQRLTTLALDGRIPDQVTLDETTMSTFDEEMLNHVASSSSSPSSSSSSSSTTTSSSSSSSSSSASSVPVPSCPIASQRKQIFLLLSDRSLAKNDVGAAVDQTEAIIDLVRRQATVANATSATPSSAATAPAPPKPKRGTFRPQASAPPAAPDASASTPADSAQPMTGIVDAAPAAVAAPPPLPSSSDEFDDADFFDLDE